MKTRILSILLVIISVKGFSQVSYEKGYFIDSNNQRIECLIKNKEWKNNPSQFDYKLEEDGKSHTQKASDVREFGIDTKSRYLSADVKIDRSSDVTAELSTNKDPFWFRERLFLKVLMQGNVSLLYYASGNFKRYFIHANDTIKQLIYKQYLSEKNELMENFTFRQQLWTEVRCGETSEAELKQVKYSMSDLLKYFGNYLSCSKGETIDYIKRDTRGGFNLKLTPGINYTSLNVLFGQNTTRSNSDVDYGSQLGFRMGVEAEIVLPYNRNKWSLIIEPNYQSFNSTNEAKEKSAIYNTFELPLGIRYYFFLNQELRIFLNGMVVIGVPVKSAIGAMDYKFEATAPGKFAFGGGLSYKRFSGEVRYNIQADILNQYLYWTAEHNRFSFIVGYRLFGQK